MLCREAVLLYTLREVKVYFKYCCFSAKSSGLIWFECTAAIFLQVKEGFFPQPRTHENVSAPRDITFSLVESRDFQVREVLVSLKQFRSIQSSMALLWVLLPLPSRNGAYDISRWYIACRCHSTPVSYLFADSREELNCTSMPHTHQLLDVVEVLLKPMAVFQPV